MDRRGTSAHSPDLDWSQVRETVLMLELAVGQIDAAMKEGNSSVEVLTDSFTSMAGYMRMMGDALDSSIGYMAPVEYENQYYKQQKLSLRTVN